MADELDTSLTPLDDGAVSPEPTPEPEPPQEPEPTPQITPDEIIRQAEERAFQRTASWMGRRDKDLIDNISTIIDARLRSAIPPQAPPPAISSDPAAILENPDAWAEAKIRSAIPAVLDQEIQRRTQMDQTYTADVIRHAGRMMEADPMFDDKNFGTEVVAEAQKQFASLDKRIPPELGAELLIHKAIASVNRKKMLEKKNPLAGNQPGRAPGNITPPVATPPKVKPPKLSETASQLAKRWGYNAEALAKLFPEG